MIGTVDTFGESLMRLIKIISNRSADLAHDGVHGGEQTHTSPDQYSADV